MSETGTREMISFGAGVNSVAMTIMLAEDGWRGPVVFADTGGEHPDTYCYLEYFEREYLKPRGMAITRIRPGSQYHRKNHAGTLEQYCLDHGMIPLLSVRWCSIEYKRDPISRWAAERGIDTQYLGICADEYRRVRYDDPTKHYPLVDEYVTRPGCIRIIQAAGLEIPRKSGCFFCPGQSFSEWRNLYLEHPDLFERCIIMEENATANRRNGKIASLDPHGVPLKDHVTRRWQGLEEMDLSDWLPCACRL